MEKSEIDILIHYKMKKKTIKNHYKILDAKNKQMRYYDKKNTKKSNSDPEYGGKTLIF